MTEVIFWRGNKLLERSKEGFVTTSGRCMRRSQRIIGIWSYPVDPIKSSKGSIERMSKHPGQHSGNDKRGNRSL